MIYMTAIDRKPKP